MTAVNLDEIVGRAIKRILGSIDLRQMDPERLFAFFIQLHEYVNEIINSIIAKLDQIGLKTTAEELAALRRKARELMSSKNIDNPLMAIMAIVELTGLEYTVAKQLLVKLAYEIERRQVVKK